MRADKFLAERFSSRTKAAEYIERGQVLVNGKVIRPKDEIKEGDEITIIKGEEEFVSNGGYKLARAKKEFSLDFSSLTCVDIGASTGGFTDCLLQGGAKKVYAVDVGESLLDPSLKEDSRVVIMDNTNARYLEKEDFAEEIEFIVTDVSFISLSYIFPIIFKVLANEGQAVALIKPQFECEGKHIGKSGIVNPQFHLKIIEKVLDEALNNGLYPVAITNAPVRKGKNIEYVLLLEKVGKSDIKTLLKRVKEIVKNNSLGILQ